MAIVIKQFYVGTTEENDERFIDELENLCKKYADDDYFFRWVGQEKAETESEKPAG